MRGIKTRLLQPGNEFSVVDLQGPQHSLDMITFLDDAVEKDPRTSMWPPALKSEVTRLLASWVDGE